LGDGKKIMFERRKILKKLRKSPAYKDAATFDYDKEGRVQINVGLKDADDFFSPYAYKTYELLNSGVTEHIDMSEGQIPITESITLEIYTEEKTTNEEKKRIRSAVKRHYAEMVVSVKRQLKINTWKGLILSAIGVVILFAEAFLYAKLSNLYLDTIMAVIGWMFLWDGMEVFLWDRSDLRRKEIKCYRLMNAKVHIRQYSKKIQRQYGIGEFEDDEED